MKGLYTELAEYTGEWVADVIPKCREAAYKLAEEWQTKTSVLDFYRNSEWYIYDLTFYQQDILGEAWYAWYRDCLRQIWKLHPKYKCGQTANGLDLGGGIGEYTIEADRCFRMDYVDVDGATKNYAMWRFKARNLSPNIYNEDFKIEKDYDFVVAMDVFEHLENPEERIKEIAEHTRYLFANPEQVKYNEKYPMHISRYDLTPYFELAGGNLWRRKCG
jgi:2-polyprenyl-3-methyl-5-hydroxy-6-metoxy-1,4-benzoquinol methylase